MNNISKCPVCRIDLCIISSGNHKTVKCQVCDGIFLSKEQMDNQFKQKSVFFNIALKATERQRQCPKDSSLMIEKCITEEDSKVFIDQCPDCKGVWFDAGEIAQANSILRKVIGQRAVRRQAEMLLKKAEHEAQQHERAPKIFEPLWWFSIATHLPIEGYNKLFRAPLITIFLITMCSLVYAIDLIFPGWLNGYTLSSKTVYENPSQLISSQFMHAGIIHLLGNLYFLKVFGDNVEDRLGRPVFLAFYLFAGIFAGMCFVNFSPAGTSVMGASGAISGILGAYVVFFPKVNVFIFPNVFSNLRLLKFSVAVYIPIWFLWQLIASSLLSGSIAWSAHIGGLIAGVTMAIYMKMFVPDARLEHLKGLAKV